MKRASDILADVYRQGRDGRDADRDLVFSYWREAAGERLAQVSRPVYLAGKMLIVETDSPEWADGLESVAAQIQVRLNAAVGRRVVEKLSFRVSRVPKRPAQRAQTSDPALDAADGIRDPQRRRLYLASKRAAGER